MPGRPDHIIRRADSSSQGLLILQQVVYESASAPVQPLVVPQGCTGSSAKELLGDKGIADLTILLLVHRPC